MLRKPVFLSPMALSLAELEALSLRTAIVQKAADEQMRPVARAVADKVAQHASNRRQTPKFWGFGVYAFERAREGFRHMPMLRRAIREGPKLRIAYRSLTHESTIRIFRSLQTDDPGLVWTCSAWCEPQGDFRTFRIDRMQDRETTGQRFQPDAGNALENHLNNVANQMNRQGGRS